MSVLSLKRSNGSGALATRFVEDSTTALVAYEFPADRVYKPN